MHPHSGIRRLAASAASNRRTARQTMSTYRLVPVRWAYGEPRIIEECAEKDRDLYAIAVSGTSGWVADFSPNHKQLAEDFVAWLTAREQMAQALRIVYRD